jgi:CRISPR/Cas system-associated endonuclease/helicase Cas3
MANLLSQATVRGFRRIIVVLPFTNIIQQSVEIYRKALVLDGEDPRLVVAELHHKADFSEESSWEYAARWNSPIIVTTAVAFFETIASHKPSTLRRLHNLPGSAIFLDEVHAMLPVRLLPLAWRWMKELADEWDTYWVLASGSLKRFWELEEIDSTVRHVPELVPAVLREETVSCEVERVSYPFQTGAMDAKALVDWVTSFPGPRLLIINTVQSAAIVARELAKLHGKEAVEHISTSLTPHDRGIVLERVRTRLLAGEMDWTLVGTSCIEAGLDLSFEVGFREVGSLVSLLQTAGRVNRGGAKKESCVWSFHLQEGNGLIRHPGLTDSAMVLDEIFRKREIVSPVLCTTAMKRELNLSCASEVNRELTRAEREMDFPNVEKQFRVIDSGTFTVVVDPDLISRIERYEHVSWREIMKQSVQIWGNRLERLGTPQIHGHPDMYKWHLDYDPFLGYMAGVLRCIDFMEGFGEIV